MADLEHKDIPEDGLHEPKGVSVAAANLVYLSDGASSGSWQAAKLAGQAGAPNNTFPLSDGAGGVTWVSARPEAAQILVATSYSDQVPTGLDLPLQVEFGPEQITGVLDIDALGNITCLEAGNFLVGLAIRPDRTSSTGVATLHLRALRDGLQEGQTQAFGMATENASSPYSATFFTSLEVGEVLTLEIYRDGGGANDGGLYTLVPSIVGWANVGSARITFQRLSF